MFLISTLLNRFAGFAAHRHESASCTPRDSAVYNNLSADDADRGPAPVFMAGEWLVTDFPHKVLVSPVKQLHRRVVSSVQSLVSPSKAEDIGESPSAANPSANLASGDPSPEAIGHIRVQKR